MDNKTRQKYYERLIAKGCPELIAASMAAQVDALGIIDITCSIVADMYTFAAWNETKEGFDFWSSMVDAFK